MPGSDVALVYGVINLLAQAGKLDAEFIASHTHGAAAFIAEASHFTIEKTAELCGLDPRTIVQFAEALQSRRPTKQS